MKTKTFKTAALLIGVLLIGFSSCSKSDDTTTVSTSRTQGIFTVLAGDTTIEMNGIIGSTSLSDFNTLYTAFPNINKIEIIRCDGSTDDQINLQLSVRVHQLNINTHLKTNGVIASGGVDFFLAGIQRTRGTNIMVGVHSWANSSGQTATDFPVGHANHLPYINYYVSVGFTQQQAEDFYYFTINASPASSIHFMTEAEMLTYTIFTS